MAPRKAATAAPTITSLMGDMSDDELGYTQAVTMIASPAKENKPVARGSRARRAPVSKASATKDTTAPAKRGKRAALEDVTNVAGGEDAVVEEPPKKRAKATATKAVPAKGAARGQKKAIEEVKENEIAATQDASVMSIEEEISEPIPEEESLPLPFPEPVARPIKAPVKTASRSQSRQPELAVSRIRGGSVPITSEKQSSDPALRRRLGELTTKCETLESRYNNLKDVATVESQSNFDKLKAETDRRAKAQEALIASLREQIALQEKLTAESQSLTTQLETSQAETDRLLSEAKTMAAELKSLKESQAKSQNEIKALQAKLATSRAQSENASSKGANAKNAVSNSASLQIANQKEDLYCDVTGLIIHGIKNLGDKKTIYDCSQTGRNGTLRFGLTVDAAQPPMTPGASMMDCAQITYAPMIDEKNDKELLDILDDYLLEEIEFPADHLQKLYTKIRDGMMRAVELCDDNSMEDDE